MFMKAFLGSVQRGIDRIILQFVKEFFFKFRRPNFNNKMTRKHTRKIVVKHSWFFFLVCYLMWSISGNYNHRWILIAIDFSHAISNLNYCGAPEIMCLIYANGNFQQLWVVNFTWIWHNVLFLCANAVAEVLLYVMSQNLAQPFLGVFHIQSKLTHHSNGHMIMV